MPRPGYSRICTYRCGRAGGRPPSIRAGPNHAAAAPTAVEYIVEIGRMRVERYAPEKRRLIVLVIYRAGQMNESFESVIVFDCSIAAESLTLDRAVMHDMRGVGDYR
jgi:hypothetical protein